MDCAVKDIVVQLSDSQLLDAFHLSAFATAFEQRQRNIRYCYDFSEANNRMNLQRPPTQAYHKSPAASRRRAAAWWQYSLAVVRQRLREQRYRKSLRYLTERRRQRIVYLLQLS